MLQDGILVAENSGNWQPTWSRNLGPTILNPYWARQVVRSAWFNHSNTYVKFKQLYDSTECILQIDLQSNTQTYFIFKTWEGGAWRSFTKKIAQLEKINNVQINDHY